jgi:hypothetical protein
MASRLDSSRHLLPIDIETDSRAFFDPVSRGGKNWRVNEARSERAEQLILIA